MDIKYLDTLEDFSETLDNSLSLLSSKVITNPLDDLYGTTSPETIQQIHNDMLALDALLEYTRDPSVEFAPDDVYIRLFERFYKHAHLSYTKRLIAGEPLTRAENEVAASQYYIDLFKERKSQS